MQTLLASIGLCQPQPKVPSELIRFLGKTYCAWHNATWMLEQHVMIFPQDPRCFDALVCTTAYPATMALGLSPCAPDRPTKLSMYALA